ncbi:hypothetical protein HDU76_013742 [Blyttiomyces sp. JEL0837]|nr:hypothetical protein HDU76_013742 [Blyttiomyces sp. JEL0837]
MAPDATAAIPIGIFARDFLEDIEIFGQHAICHEYGISITDDGLHGFVFLGASAANVIIGSRSLADCGYEDLWGVVKGTCGKGEGRPVFEYDPVEAKKSLEVESKRVYNGVSHLLRKVGWTDKKALEEGVEGMVAELVDVEV